MAKLEFTGLYVYVTGDEPFCGADIQAILKRGGAIVCVPKPGQPISFVVIGRKSYDEATLNVIWPATTQESYISQESLIEMILLDRTPGIIDPDKNDQSHSGLHFANRLVDSPQPAQSQRLKDRVDYFLDTIKKFGQLLRGKPLQDKIKIIFSA